jgi:hypothetical protein
MGLLLVARRHPPPNRIWFFRALKTFAVAFAVIFTFTPTVVVGSMVGGIVPATLYLFHCLLNAEARRVFWHDSNATAALSYLSLSGILALVVCCFVLLGRFFWTFRRAQSEQDISN